MAPTVVPAPSAGIPRITAAVTLTAWAVRGETHVAILPLQFGGDMEAQVTDPGLRALGHAPVARRASHRERRATAGASPTVDEQVEHVFLDLSLCFNRSVRLHAVEFFAVTVEPLRTGRFRWRILHPIPSRSQAATQWFRVDGAWPLVASGEAVEAAYPTPGAYGARLEPGFRLGFGDCVGWSLAGAGDGPFAFDQNQDTQVAWARSSGGLHDAVELYVKRGLDPLTAQQRQELQIGWTGLEQRTYSLRLLYSPVEELPPAAVPPSSPSGTGGGTAAPVIAGGNPACWRNGFTFESCCGPSGNEPGLICWDAFFTYERCCTLTAVQRFSNLNFTAPPSMPHYELPHLMRDNAPRLGPVQDDEALLLYGLARATRPRTIVEFGTSNGFSAVNWMHAIADDPEAMVFSYDILPYPAGTNLEDADPRFVFLQKSQADFDPQDVYMRPVDIAFFDAGHLVEYSLQAFERILPSLSPVAVVAVHDTGLHVMDHGSGAPADEEGLPFSEERCAARPGGPTTCHRFVGCRGHGDAHGHCVGRAHRPSERQFVREVLRRWPSFRPLHVHSRRVFRHGMTLLQQGGLWDPVAEPSGDF